MPHSIFFTFNCAYDHDFRDYRAGDIPKHRFFGVFDLIELGHKVAYCTVPKGWNLILRNEMAWRFYQMLHAVTHQSRYDCVVAASEACAFPLLLVRRLGLLRKPVIVANVAMLRPRYIDVPRNKRVIAWLLAGADRVVSYSSAQMPELVKEFGLDERRIVFLPLGADMDFLQPKNLPPAAEPYCAAVGTNQGKDYPTLIAALPDGVKLVVVTDAHNAEVIARCVRPGQRVEVRQAVPFAQLKDIYEQALCMIIPLSEARYSSGQTVLLENMAMGKPVVVSDVSSVRDYVRAGVDALTAPDGDAAALRQIIGEIWENPQRFAAIGERARQRVKERFSSLVVAEELATLIGSLKAG